MSINMLLKNELIKMIIIVFEERSPSPAPCPNSNNLMP